MRLRFKTLAYETNAIESVVDCFDGQPISSIWPEADLRWSLLLSCNHNKWMQQEKLRCDYANSFYLVGHPHPA